ncbi:chemotaxis protein CheW [Spirulina subsalsa FACHB-351]|uniref:Chemotaxis protein CheW n=1 Tax=Spirulina subsalsa FACHB-351 TaxID=234711 RepID=A0ABT3LBV8_9CYAN|nr:chemotaxis protein CheW [Spirulina subsalsa]MCW6038993.1 chemotaxis protein CheW [Spirulina subsalsa FACHB-351]
MVQTGNLQAIRTLLNQKLQPQGITVNTTTQGSKLIIQLTASQACDRTRTVSKIQESLKTQKPQGFQTVDITAHQAGKGQLWTHRLTLTPPTLTIDLAAWLESGSSLQESILEPSSPLEPDGLTSPPTLREKPVIEPVSPEQRYLCFQLGLDNKVMLPVEYIQEIVRVGVNQVLAVPDTPSYALGLYNWRGEMLWLVDLNLLLGLESFLAGQNSSETALHSGLLNILVLKDQQLILGVIVQQVEEIEQHSPDQLQSPLGLFTPELEPFILGYFREVQSIVLNAEAIFTMIHEQSYQ